MRPGGRCQCFPSEHHKRFRYSHLIERTFSETRPRVKVGSRRAQYEQRQAVAAEKYLGTAVRYQDWARQLMPAWDLIRAAGF
jgi:hypothetical protein